MALVIFAAFVSALGFLGAVLNLLAALFVRDGRGALRMFSFLVCSVVCGAYVYAILYSSPISLVPEVGRVLVAALVTIAGCWAGIDLYVWLRMRGLK